jgi:DNA primase
MRLLAKRAGVTLKTSNRTSIKSSEREIILNINRDALVFFREQLSANARARKYLEGRGLNEDALTLFSIGFAPKSWNALLSYLTGKGHRIENLVKSGLVSKGAKGAYDALRERIIFPIIDLRGDVIAFGGRSLDGSEPKYINSPETPVFNKRRVLYGLNIAKDSIKKSGSALFMEGYLDVISAHMNGFTYSVAPLGTACTQEHGSLIKRFTEDVVLVFDSDQAGIKAAQKAAGILLDAGLNVRVLSVPNNEDPDSFLRQKGREAFNDLLHTPLSIVDFMLRQKGNRRIIAREAIEIISRIPDRVLQGAYTKELAERLGVNEMFVMEELKKVKNQPQSRQWKSPDKNRTAPEPKPINEVYIIKLLFQLPESSKAVSGVLSLDDFSHTMTKKVFDRICKGAHSLDNMISESEGDEKSFLTEIAMMDDIDEPEKALEDCTMRLRENRRKLRLHEIQGRIRDAEKKKDFELLRKLQSEQQDLLRQGTA